MENHGFDVFLSHLCSQNNPLSRPFWPCEGPKLLNMGSKWAHFTCLCTPNSPKRSLKKHIFDPFLTNLWSQNDPFSKHFVTLELPKWLAMGSKWAHFTCLCTPNGLGSFSEKHIFHPFLTHFLPIFFGPKTTHFQNICDFGGAKMACNGLKMGSFHLFRHPKWPSWWAKEHLLGDFHD